MENYSNYPKSFIDLVNEVNKKKNQSDVQYIGVGNPNAKIFIIGKESAINTKEEEGKKQHEKENLKNAEGWQENIKKDMVLFNADKEELWKKDPEAPINPLYPYRGQYFRIDTGQNYGTSRTWYDYQKVINKMESVSLSDERKQTICFHEYCFSTELSSVSAKHSKEADAKKRKESIGVRTTELLKLPFYQQFPIVIVAAGHYPKEFGIDLEELFGVKWDGKTIDKSINERLKRNWLNIHHGNQPKLLIHTNQLSINITDELLCLIAKECDKFVKTHNIKL